MEAKEKEGSFRGEQSQEISKSKCVFEYFRKSTEKGALEP